MKNFGISAALGEQWRDPFGSAMNVRPDLVAPATAGRFLDSVVPKPVWSHGIASGAVGQLTKSFVKKSLRTQLANTANVGLGRQLADVIKVKSLFSDSYVAHSGWATRFAKTWSFEPPPLLKLTRGFMLPERRWFKRLSERLRRAGLLPNWQSIENLDLDVVEELLWAGIPLAVVPRATTVEALLAAEGQAERRRILANRWRSITTDCLQVLDDLSPTYLARIGKEAINTLRDGHVEAAQALAANVIDTALRRDLHPDFKSATWLNQRNKGHKRPELEQWAALAAWVFRPVWAAYRGYYSTGDLRAAPRMFYRHATAHGASRIVYNRPNAVIAVMLATSVLWLVEFHGKDSPVIVPNAAAA